MNVTVPSLEEVRRYLKSELGRIQKKGYSAEEIHACITEYAKRASDYDEVVKRFSTRVSTAPEICKYVHSVRFRLKDPFHLADKLVRKCLDKKHPRKITARSLFDPKKGVADLGAVRILHLRREEWEHIHRQLTKKDAMPGFRVVEKIAYVKADKVPLYRGRGKFSRKEIRTDTENGYTSLHYIFQARDFTTPLLVECQVRTIFEEGWGEIDHQMNYPYKANSIVGGYLASLDATAHAANEVASKLDTLSGIPLFVPWDAELRLERSADVVYCVTPDLGWVAAHLDGPDGFVQHVYESAGTFQYFIIKNDAQTRANVASVKRRLKTEGLLGKRVTLSRVPSRKRLIPVISDLLLLEKASDPVSRKEYSVSVVGAPPQRPSSTKERLDMLITDESAVQRLREFFHGLRE